MTVTISSYEFSVDPSWQYCCILICIPYYTCLEMTCKLREKGLLSESIVPDSSWSQGGTSSSSPHKARLTDSHGWVGSVPCWVAVDLGKNWFLLSIE